MRFHMGGKKPGAAMHPPEQQVMVPLMGVQPAAASSAELEATIQTLQAKEAQLQALSQDLDAAEQAVLATMQQQKHMCMYTQQLLLLLPPDCSNLDQQCKGYPADAVTLPVGAQSATASAEWQCLAAKRSELLVKWQCLLEEKKQLSLLLQRRQGGLSDFEPGETPMRDVTCSVITHQMDVPCFSCCFQR